MGGVKHRWRSRVEILESDAGFFISEQRKKEKINESGYGADYQGDVNPQKKQKKKTVTTNNIW
jgi:hypothetical protein